MGRRRSGAVGFTLIELIVVIVVISVLATLAADRLFYYRERAEKAMMDETLELVKMGLRVRMAELVVSNRSTEIPQLQRQNPMRWMDEPPAGYAGEYVKPAKPGSWYYATEKNELIYVPSSTSYLDTGPNNDKELHFRVAIRFQSEQSGGGRAMAGIGLAPTKHYRWF